MVIGCKIACVALLLGAFAEPASAPAPTATESTTNQIPATNADAALYTCDWSRPEEVPEWCWRYSHATAATAAATVAIPLLPWPPPRPTHFLSLKGTVSTNGTLGAVADRLAARLKARDYENFLYYEVPGGFAITTELERFGEDGGAIGGDDRFQRGKLGGYYGFADLLHKVFVGEDGHFRVFIFIVTDRPYPIADDPAIEGDVERWGRRGSLYMPRALASQKTNAKTAVTLLIYEFAEDRGRNSTLTATGRTVPASAHLRWLGLSR